MKYYTLSYQYKRSQGVINYGDNYQSLAVQSFLKRQDLTDFGFIVRDTMGIKDRNREKGIFIVATGGLAWNHYPKNDDMPINDHNLELVYFGTRIPEGSLDVLRSSHEFWHAMKKYEPIGCRDVNTRDFFRSLGIKAYYSKCVTLLFDERDESLKGNKIFIADESTDAYRGYIPDHVLAGIEHLPVTFDAPSDGPMDEADARYVEKCALDRLEYLKENAKLVISPRIHMVMPCAAAGIPVLFLDTTNPDSARTSVVRDLFPHYSLEELKEYDWDNIEQVSIAKEKQEMERLLKLRLEQAHERIGEPIILLSDEEREIACDQLEKLCQVDGVAQNYMPQTFVLGELIEALLGEKKKDVQRLSHPVVILGAGDLGWRLKVILQKAGIATVCYCDSSQTKNETGWYQGVPVISRNTLAENHKSSYVIVAVHGPQDEIIEELLAEGFNEKFLISTKQYCKEYIEYIPPLPQNFWS